jgi:hypothetical protein
MKDSPKRVPGNIRGITEVDPWTMLSLSTMLLALSIGLGPQLGIVPIAIFSVFWGITTVWLSAVLFRLGRSEYRWLFGIGVGLATLRMTSLGLIQVIQNRPALFWNIDWRYHATHAQGIARFGGAADTLDFAGAPLQYHAGPSWIAGALQNVVGIPVNVVLFVLVPGVCVAVIAVSSVRILRVLNVQRHVALTTISICMNLPKEIPSNVARFTSNPSPTRAVDLVLNPETWMFSPQLMLNSLLALCVGLVAISTILSARYVSTLIIGGACLGSLMFLKPQYLIGFASVLAIGLIFNASSQVVVRPRLVVGIPLLTATVVAGFAIYLTGGGVFSEVQLDFSFLTQPRTFLPEILMWLILVGPLLFFNRELNTWDLRKFAVGALIGYAALVFAVKITTFLIDPSFIANANSAGARISRASSDGDWAQAYLPASFILAVLTFAMLFSFCLVRLKGPRVMVGFSVVVFVFVMPLTLGPLIQPTGPLAYEWTEEQDLAALMKSVEFTDGVWLSSDLADPDRNFIRPVENYNLTSLVGAQFYISGSKWNVFRPDFSVRISNSQKFFGTRWSGWHDGFLSQNNVNFVLVRDRCPVMWFLSDFPGSIVETKGDWLLLEVGGTASSTQGTDRWFKALNVDPVYGLSECRSLERVKN